MRIGKPVLPLISREIPNIKKIIRICELTADGFECYHEKVNGKGTA